MDKLREAFFWYGHKVMPVFHKWNYEDAVAQRTPGRILIRNCRRCGRYQLGYRTQRGRWVAK